MIVDGETFSKLKAGAVFVQTGGVDVPTPKVEHIVALKLHAAKTRPRETVEKDWLDIFQLIKQHNLRLSAPEYRGHLSSVMEENKHSTDSVQRQSPASRLRSDDRRP